jgi:hypothetical protein
LTPAVRDQMWRMRGKTSFPNIVNLSITASGAASAVWKNRSSTPTPASSRQRLIWSMTVSGQPMNVVGSRPPTLGVRASPAILRESRRSEACGLLAPIYGWFTEGFDTADLKDAKVLLETLA